MGFIIRLWFADHSQKCCMSLSNYLTTSANETMSKYWVICVSSAKDRSFDVELNSGRSAVYIRYKRGLRTDPWGPSETTDYQYQL